MQDDPFQPWLDRWALTPDGAAFQTKYGSRLMPVLSAGQPAMLKIAGGEEERQGAALMAWYAGEGAARVLEHDDWVILLERATGERRLDAMATDGQDDEATAILCQVAAGLRHSAPPPASTSFPLPIWFRQLEPAAANHGGTFAKSAAAARASCSETPGTSSSCTAIITTAMCWTRANRDGSRSTRRGLIGERGFEYANLFRNPDGAIERAPGRMRRQAAIDADQAGWSTGTAPEVGPGLCGSRRRLEPGLGPRRGRQGWPRHRRDRRGGTRRHFGLKPSVKCSARISASPAFSPTR